MLGHTNYSTSSLSARFLRTASLGLLMVSASMLIGGCRDEPGESKYSAVPGTIEEINVTNHVIKFRYKRTKSDEYRDRSVIVPADAEILINGRLSELSDLKLGDPVFGIWRIERIGGKDRVFAVKIEVVREENPQDDDAAKPSD